MVCRVSYSAVSGSLEPWLMSDEPPMELAAPHTRFCGCKALLSSAKTALVMLRHMAMGSWLAGRSLISASAGLTPTACGPISGYSLEPRVSVAVICDQWVSSSRQYPASARTHSDLQQRPRKRPGQGLCTFTEETAGICS